MTQTKNEADQGAVRTRALDRLYRYVPTLESLRTYSWRSLRLDVLAGLTVAAVAVPQAMAYATIAGLPAQYGLYTAIVMTAIGAIFDSSKQLINGPTNAISIALFSALALQANEQDRVQLAILIALLVGVIQIGITLLRLGDLTRYVSHAVIVGFTLGAAVLIVLSQVRHVFGLPDAGEPHDHFLVRFWETIAHGAPVNMATMMISLGTVAIILLLRRLRTHTGIHLPEFLLATIVMATLVWAGDLHHRGVAVVGEIPRALPAFQLPVISWASLREVAGSALAIAVLGLLEAVAMAKAIATRTRQKIDINQQCLSEGLANFTGSFFQCFPGSGSLTRSAINQQAGAVSQLSGVFSAVAVAVTMLLLAPMARFIPRAALAGILIVSAWRLIDRKQLAYHLRTTRFDAGIVLATALSAVIISVEFCILIGVFLSFVMYVPRAAQVFITELTLTPERVLRERQPGDPTCGRILIVNLEGELFFGSAPDLEKQLESISARTGNGLRVLVMRLKRVRNPDAVCLSILNDFVQHMRDSGVSVLFCGVRPDLMKVLNSSGLTAKLRPQRIFREDTATWSSTLDAVRHAYEILGSNLCDNCPRREKKEETLYYMI